VVVGVLVYQVSGWLVGERVFASVNSEAMLFTFLAASGALLCWLFSRSAADSSLGRSISMINVALGVALGVMFRSVAGGW
jgi:hypothetical protein